MKNVLEYVGCSMTEHELQSAILDYLTLRGAVATRVNSGGFVIKGDAKARFVRGAPAGTADIIACYRGRYVAIEVKFGRGKATVAQIDWGCKVRDAGGVYIIANSLETVESLLDCLDKKEDK